MYLRCLKARLQASRIQIGSPSGKCRLPRPAICLQDHSNSVTKEFKLSNSLTLINFSVTFLSFSFNYLRRLLCSHWIETEVCSGMWIKEPRSDHIRSVKL
jgi:hypothetical protein